MPNRSAEGSLRGWRSPASAAQRHDAGRCGTMKRGRGRWSSERMSMAAKGQTRGARSLEEVLEALATPSGTPAGGAAVSLAGGKGAALVELCCRAGGAQAGGGQVEALAADRRETHA